MSSTGSVVLFRAARREWHARSLVDTLHPHCREVLAQQLHVRLVYREGCSGLDDELLEVAVRARLELREHLRTVEFSWMHIE